MASNSFGLEFIKFDSFQARSYFPVKRARKPPDLWKRIVSMNAAMRFIETPCADMRWKYARWNARKPPNPTRWTREICFAANRRSKPIYAPRTDWQKGMLTINSC
jgi:hypothetical protein